MDIVREDVPPTPEWRPSSALSGLLSSPASVKRYVPSELLRARQRQGLCRHISQCCNGIGSSLLLCNPAEDLSLTAY